MQMVAERDFPIALVGVSNDFKYIWHYSVAKLFTDQCTSTLPPASNPDWMNLIADGKCSKRFSSPTSSAWMQ